MEFNHSRTVKYAAILLILAALSQPIYTAFYILAPEVDRQFLWGIEGWIFVLMAAFAGAAMVKSNRFALVFSAIAMSAVLNVVQVGVGLTQFGPFREVAEAVEGVGPAASSVVAFSFFSYNGAKMLLGLAAIIVGMAKVNDGGKALGGLTALAGAIAFLSNAVVMAFGLSQSVTGGGLMPSGASGVIATLLLGVCLLGYSDED